MRTRLLIIILSAIALALLFIAVSQAVQSFQDNDAAQLVSTDDLERAYAPPLIRDVRMRGRQIELSGDAHPDAVITVKSLPDTNLRQVRADDAGRWAVPIAYDAEPMFLSVDSHTDGIKIAGDETLIFLPAPGAEDGIAQLPMIAVTVPGGPTRVFQTPFGEPLTDGALSLDAVEYDRAGGAILSGQASTQGTIQLASRGRVLGATEVTPDGRWFFMATDIGGQGGKRFTLSLDADTGEWAELSVEIPILPLGEDFVRDARIWQVRRTLLGGGTQVTAIFARPPASSDPDETAPQTQDG